MTNEALSEEQLAVVHMPPQSIGAAITELALLAPTSYGPELETYYRARDDFFRTRTATAEQVALVLRVDRLQDMIGRAQDRVSS